MRVFHIRFVFKNLLRIIIILAIVTLLLRWNQKQSSSSFGSNLIKTKDYTNSNPHNLGPDLILIRNIGNNIPSRHALNQSVINLQFILQHEPKFPNTQRHWVLNRIVDRKVFAQLLHLLETFQESYTIIPFNLSIYSELPFLFHSHHKIDFIHSPQYQFQIQKKVQRNYIDKIYDIKNRYITNINEARNEMLNIGRLQYNATWILPWDGNCFLTKRAFELINETLTHYGNVSKYFITPMDRLKISNEVVLNSNYSPIADEEPQIIFHHTAQARFDPHFSYGRRNKVELLLRLGVPGEWTEWTWASWDKDFIPKYNSIADAQNTSIRVAGWVARLTSGQQHLEKKGSIVKRGLSRSYGLENILLQLDVQVAEQLFGFSSENLLYFDEHILHQEKTIYQHKNRYDKNMNKDSNYQYQALIKVIERLDSLSQDSLHYGPWSVVNKTELPPSEDLHDYYHPAPYYWPNPNTPNGLPYIPRDGYRRPESVLHSPLSNKFDRSRLIEMQYNTTILALAWYFTNRKAYAIKAAQNLRIWFLDPSTKMKPRLKFAQIRWGHSENNGQSTGIIEFKDLYFFLDAIRLVFRSGELSLKEFQEIQFWFEIYLEWLLSFHSGRKEYTARNNHGLYFDIQVASIAAFINDTKTLVKFLHFAKSRLYQHINSKGKLVHELKRTRCEHYQMFTLQGWIILTRIAEKLGINYFKWNETREKQSGSTLCRACEAAVPHIRSRKVCEGNMVVENEERWWPIYYTFAKYCTNSSLSLLTHTFEENSLVTKKPSVCPYNMNQLYYEEDGIAPFWSLGLDDKNFSL